MIARVAALIGCVLALVPGASQAQSAQPAPSSPPPCSAPEYRQFDFWIGEWTVTDSAGTRTFGTNTIRREDGGCLLLERWVSAGTGANSNTGHSVNAYDRSTGQWGQDWVGSDGTVLHLRGGLENGRMVLASRTTGPSGAVQRQRITWTPQPDGSVRQLWEGSTDDGQTWTVAFDGWYRRLKP